MTSKTKQTLETINNLAGIPHLHASAPCLIVPALAWGFYSERQPPEVLEREWWQTGRGKYDAGLLFRLRD